MADLSKITLPNGSTYDLKDTAAAASIESTGGNGVRLKKRDGTSYSDAVDISTQDLARPTELRGLDDVTLQPLINTARANRLAFLPADQIIIEQTIDGGTTWTDAGVGDASKLALFSETRPNVYLPRINNVPDIKCGLRITFTAMKYDVPDGTAETEKYNYWNSDHVLYQERYSTLKEFYFWLTSNDNTIGIKVQRATGAASTSWNTIFDDSSFYMTGWAGADYVRFAQDRFGGASTQVNQPWNYRIILMTKGVGGTSTMGSSTAAQCIHEIRGYGDNVWGTPNQYMYNDHMYSKDYNKNVTFPAQVTATNFNGKINNHTINSDVPSGAKFTDYNKFFVGTCTTAAGTKDKVVTLTDDDGFELKTGVVVAVKFSHTNSYASSTSNPVTLNVNGTGAKNIYYNQTHSGAGNTGSTALIYGIENKYIYYMYDGTYWVWVNQGSDYDTNYHMPSCTTAAGTAAKTAVCSYYIPKANSYIPIAMYYDNTAASALTLNIQSQGAKPIWINGEASSSTNHTLPRGTYIIYYDGTNYYFRTDGQLPTGGVSVNEKAHIVYNATTNALDFVFD